RTKVQGLPGLVIREVKGQATTNELLLNDLIHILAGLCSGHRPSRCCLEGKDRAIVAVESVEGLSQEERRHGRLLDGFDFTPVHGAKAGWRRFENKPFLTGVKWTYCSSSHSYDH